MGSHGHRGRERNGIGVEDSLSFSPKPIVVTVQAKSGEQNFLKSFMGYV